MYRKRIFRKRRTQSTKCIEIIYYFLIELYALLLHIYKYIHGSQIDISNIISVDICIGKIFMCLLCLLKKFDKSHSKFTDRKLYIKSIHICMYTYCTYFGKTFGFFSMRWIIYCVHLYIE